MNLTQSKRIALIHALPHSLDPVRAAFTEHWPEAELVNLLDDSLGTDLSRASSLSDKITDRIVSLGNYANSLQAEGILFTCSAFGKAIDIVKQKLDVPVLKPNEAMFEAALRAGGSIGMLASFAPSVPSMEAEFQQLAKERGTNYSLTTILVEEAMAMLNNGDAAGHNMLIEQAAESHFQDFDIVMLAQFSMAQAHSSVSAAINAPVLTSPASAVLQLKQDLLT